jgi:hypothetical protein
MLTDWRSLAVVFCSDVWAIAAVALATQTAITKRSFLKLGISNPPKIMQSTRKNVALIR